MTIHRFTAMESRHLAFIRSLPCAACGVCIRIEAAHVRYPDALAGKPLAGMGAKPDPFWTIPLCTGCHRDQHERGDERAWWALRGFDPDSPSLSILTLCVALWRVTGDPDAGKTEIAQHRMNVRLDRQEREHFAEPPRLERPVKRRRGPGPQGRNTFPKSTRKLQGQGFATNRDGGYRQKLNGRTERREGTT